VAIVNPQSTIRNRYNCPVISKPERWSRFAPHLVVFTAFVLRIANLNGESLWRDEVDSVRFAFESLSAILTNFTSTGFNGPLYHLALRGWFALAGVSDFTLRYFSLVFGVLLVALVYVLGARLFGRSAGLAAMAFAAIAPVLVWYAGEGKMYSLQPALLTLALYALVRAVDWRMGIGEWGMGNTARHSPFPIPHSVWWLTFILATSFSFYVHLLSPVFLIVAVTFFFAMWPQAKQRWRGGLIALALLTLPYLPLAMWQLPTFVQGGDVGHAFVPLNQMAQVLLSNWTLGLDPRAPLLNLQTSDALSTLVRTFAMGFAIALAMIGVLSRRAGETWRMRIAVLVWLIAPMLVVYIVSTRFPIFQPRYLLWSAPALFLLMGLGVARLRVEGRAGRVASVLAFVVISAVGLSGVLAQGVHPIRPDLRGAAAYLMANMQPDDVVVFQIPYGRHSFSYYAERLGKPIDQTRIVEAPYTNAGMDEADVAAELTLAIAGAPRVWLVETEVAMWDQRNLARQWFDLALTPSSRQDFRGVNVGLYVSGAP
jgi:4-amino-4-deoxy-L-arabinose transferase-like glycosyltransferase